MNRRNFIRNLVGAALIGWAQPLGKLEYCPKIDSRTVVEADIDEFVKASNRVHKVYTSCPSKWHEIPIKISAELAELLHKQYSGVRI